MVNNRVRPILGVRVFTKGNLSAMGDFLSSLCRCGPAGLQDYGAAACSRNLLIKLTSLLGSDLFLYALSVLTLSVGAITDWKLCKVASLSSSRIGGLQVHNNPQYKYTPSQRSPQVPYTQESHNSFLAIPLKTSVRPQNPINANTLNYPQVTTLIKQQVLRFDITMYDTRFSKVFQYCNNTSYKKPHLFFREIFKFCYMVPQISFFHKRQHQVQIQFSLERSDQVRYQMVVKLRYYLSLVQDSPQTFLNNNPKY